MSHVSQHPLSGHDQGLALAEERVWSAVSRRGPDPEILAVIVAAIEDDPNPRVRDDELRALYREVRRIDYARVNDTLAHHVLTDAFRVAGVVWEAYQDGFDAGLARGRAESALGRLGLDPTIPRASDFEKA